MSPELETLDQLLGGDLSIPVVRGLFGNDEGFVHGVTMMLVAGEIRLLGSKGEEVPHWQWREVLTADAGGRFTITEAGVRRIA